MNNDMIKQGAYYLLRGGTLLSEPCKKCGNLQIKYKDDVICMSCQHIEQSKSGEQETVAIDYDTKKKSSKSESDKEDKRTLNTYDDIHGVLSQIERQILQTLVEYNIEQIVMNSPKKYKKYLELVQTGLKTIEMIRRVKQL